MNNISHGKSSARADLLRKINHTVERTRIQTQPGFFFAAGAHQFRTLWTRDFCFSVPGLLKLGWADDILKQLKLIYEYRLPDKFLPRGLDCVSPKWRVVRATALRKKISEQNDYKAPLKAEYLGEHGTPAFDSNLLFLKAMAQQLKFHSQKTGQPLSPWLNNSQVRELLRPYSGYTQNGLIHQPAFSDWQDSAARNGACLHTQLLYLSVVKELGELNFDRGPSLVDLGAVRKAFAPRENGFLWREFLNSAHISLDSQILLFRDLPDLIEDLESYFKVLKNHPLWQPGHVPGRPVFPNYASRHIAWTTKVVGLRHYHDELIWGWLIAGAVKICQIAEDHSEANRLIHEFARADHGGDFLSEVYSYSGEGHLRRVKQWLYQSEGPFTWTAATWADCLLESK